MQDLRNEYNIELPRAKGAYLEEAPDAIWTEEGWCLEVKADGTRESLQLGSGDSLLVGRNREGFLKGVEQAGPFQVHHHPELSALQCPEWEGTLLDGELTEHFTQSGEHDENTRVRERNGVFLGFTVWQALYLKGKDLRGLPDHERRTAAMQVIQALNHPKIRLIERYPATMKKLEEIHASGEEGAVAKYIYGTVSLKNRICNTWYKIKSALSADGFITGVTQGKVGGSGVKGIKPVPSGTAASFTISMYDASGKIVQVAKVKALPADVAEEGFKNFDKYRNKVIEVRVSGWNGKTFRWARWMRLRDDKNPGDCLFEEQIGA